MKFLTLDDKNEVVISKLKAGYCGFCEEREKPVIVKDEKSICYDCINQLEQLIK